MGPTDDAPRSDRRLGDRRPIPVPRARGKPRVERHYYTKNELFEQSLDVYRPSSSENPSSSSSSSSPPPPPPIVALVVGSAWLGHRSFVYSGTSWWNSSGPKAVADLGYVCVCIRHRGSFMKSLSMLTMAFVAVVVAILAAILNAVADESFWVALEEMAGGLNVTYPGRAGGFVLAFLAGLLLIELGNAGSANFDDMQNDVMDALSWLDDNDERLDLARSLGARGRDANSRNRRAFVFGGYSSGGHVAATVTQRPHLWKDRNLPPPHVHCDSMLYISPVLSTKSHYRMVLEKRTSSMPSSTSTPSLTSSSDEGSTAGRLSRQSSSTTTESSSIAPPEPSPTWLTDRVVAAVFGNGASAVPSPIHSYERSPGIPHAFLGCENEVFGLNWLDAFFCAESYCELLNDAGVDSRYTAVESDHWNVLGSEGLSVALENELGRIASVCAENEK